MHVIEVKSVSEKLVAMVALDALEKLITACCEHESAQSLREALAEASELVDSPRSQRLLAEYREDACTGRINDRG